jgi:hypothetical protein
MGVTQAYDCHNELFYLPFELQHPDKAGESFCKQLDYL